MSKPTPVENVQHRSKYGDMHAHREAEGMKDHVARMLAAGQIDDKMATELVKPPDKGREYTAEYLATLPTYTGKDPDMVSFETAEKNRRKRNKEQLKWIEDFEAGRIDEDGNRLVPEDEHEGSEHDSDVSQETEVSVEERVDAHYTGDTPSPEPMSPPPRRRAVSSVQPAPVAQPKPKRKRTKAAPVVVPDPLPGGETYEGFSYKQLLATGRHRQTYTPGGFDSVRKALIEDDYNKDKGLPRNLAPWKKDSWKYKYFHTEVPEELKIGGKKKPKEDDEGEEE